MSLWEIKLPRGKKENVPNLSLGRLAYVTDEGELYIGGVNGENINITNNSQLTALSQNKQDKITSTEWFDIPLMNGVTNYHSAKYKKEGNVITLKGRISNVSGSEMEVGQLPLGFMPKEHTYFPVCINGYHIATGVIDPTGIIKVGRADAEFTSTQFLSLNISFRID